MPPFVVFLLGLGVIYWLLRKDSELHTLPSKATWIPLLWLAILGSRAVSGWLTVMGFPIEGSVHGNLVDSTAYSVLIISAFITLSRRNFQWGVFCTKNTALILVYFFLGCTAIWADDSISTLKRVFKDFGNVAIALVILTESDPFAAIRIVYVRLSYLIFVLSFVFIKWFPDIGRRPDRGGSALFCGVATHKSTLGLIVFVFALFIVVDIHVMRSENKTKQHRLHLWIRYGMMAMGVWLLKTSSSTTSIICLLLGIALFYGSRKVAKLGSAKKIIFCSLAVLLLGLVAENAFHLSTELMIAVGKDPTMTGRTEIWSSVENGKIYPVLGYGYYSYWESAAGLAISKGFLDTLKTIHNGYLEMYVDCGMVGLTLLLILLGVWCYRAVERSLDGSPAGRLSLVFWCLAIIYNFSETSYFRLEPMWFTLLLLMMDYPTVNRQPASIAQ